MVDEAEKTVQEEPASAKAKSQKWVIALMCLLLVALVGDVIYKSMKFGEEKEQQAQNENAEMIRGMRGGEEDEAAYVRSSSEQQFNNSLARARVKQAEKQKRIEEAEIREINKQLASPNPDVSVIGGENLTEEVELSDDQKRESLKKRRNELMQQHSQGNFQQNQITDAFGDVGRNISNASQTGEKVDPFIQAELNRVRNARRSGFGVKFKQDGAPGSAGALPINPRTLAQRPQPPAALVNSGASLEQQRSAVLNEIERVKKLRDQIQSGAIKPHQLGKNPLEAIKTPGGVASLTQNSPFYSNNGIGDVLSQIKKARTSQNTPERVVGQVAEDQQPKPGQELLSTATVIRASLDQITVSDYVGSYRCRVQEDVYDITLEHVLIPKGSKCMGKTLRMNNVNEPIQARMGLTIEWIILPNGKRISLKKKSSVFDREGVAGLKDEVNYHFMAQFLGVAAYALLSTETDRNSNAIGSSRDFEGDFGEALREQFAPLAQRYLNLVPTITLNAGTPMRLFIEDDLYITPWTSVNENLLSSN